MACPHGLDLTPEGCGEAAGQHAASVSVAFALAYGQLAPLKIEVFDAEAQGFAEPEAAAIEEVPDEPEGSVEVPQHGGHLGGREDDRQAFGPGYADEV